MATVIVGCKLPNGLIIELNDKQVKLNGANTANIIGGHGITENVDKEFFDAWIAKHAEKEFVKLGLIFAHEKMGTTAAEAKEKAEEKTGLEPLDPAAKPAGITAVG